MSDLGTNITLAFSRALGTIDLRCPGFRSLRAVTASTMFSGSTGRLPGSMFPKALAFGGDSTGILTSYPFVQLELRLDLGSTNPRLIGSAEEPLLFRPSGFSPDFRCYCDQDFRYYVVHMNSHPCFHPRSMPTYSITRSRVRSGLGSGFEPRSFSAPRTSAGKLLRFS